MAMGCERVISIVSFSCFLLVESVAFQGTLGNKDTVMDAKFQSNRFAL